MALRKDPERRYATAAHLAEDLERYLDGRPVVARGHSLVYRAPRFVRRHRLVVIAVSIGRAVDGRGYTVLSVRHAREWSGAAARERQDAASAREVADFVVGLFEAGRSGRRQNERDADRADARSRTAAQPTRCRPSRCCRRGCSTPSDASTSIWAATERPRMSQRGL